MTSDYTETFNINSKCVSQQDNTQHNVSSHKYSSLNKKQRVAFTNTTVFNIPI